MKLWEFFWVPAVEIPGPDSLPLAFELSGRNRKKRRLSWGLGKQCVEAPSELPPAPKAWTPWSRCPLLTSPSPFPQTGPAQGPPARESAGWASLGIVVSRSVVVLILPLHKWGGIICVLIADNPYKCHLSPCGLYPLCCSSIFTVLVVLDLSVQCPSDHPAWAKFLQPGGISILPQSTIPFSKWLVVSSINTIFFCFPLHSHPDWSQRAAGTLSGDFSQCLPN